MIRSSFLPLFLRLAAALFLLTGGCSSSSDEAESSSDSGPAAAATDEGGAPDQAGSAANKNDLGATSTGGEGSTTAEDAGASDGGPGDSGAAGTVDAGGGFEPQAEDFPCMLDGVPVRRFFVHNLLGDAEGSAQVARGEVEGPFPEGTLLHLIPQEAMVKRQAGWSPETND